MILYSGVAVVLLGLLCFLIKTSSGQLAEVYDTRGRLLKLDVPDHVWLRRDMDGLNLSQRGIHSQEVVITCVHSRSVVDVVFWEGGNLELIPNVSTLDLSADPVFWTSNGEGYRSLSAS